MTPGRKAAIDKYYARNRELCSQRTVACHKKKREEYNRKQKEWREANPEKVKIIRERWLANNRGKELERKRRYAERIRNVDHLSAAENLEVEGFYLFCKIFKGFEVDHVIPLNGETVSGLHVPWNLQILPRSVNRAKGNKYAD